MTTTASSKPAVIRAPGVISHTSQFAKMVCGRLDGKPDAQLAAFVAAAKDAGIDSTQSDTINRERWEKFVFLVGQSGSGKSTFMRLLNREEVPTEGQIFVAGKEDGKGGRGLR